MGIDKGWSVAGSIAGPVCSRVRLGGEARGSADGEEDAIGLEVAGCVEESAPSLTFSFSLSALKEVSDADAAGSGVPVVGIARLDISTGFEEVGGELREELGSSCVLSSLWPGVFERLEAAACASVPSE